jgi:dTDP-4-amino-4,6-dideoxygalactose transaminase
MGLAMLDEMEMVSDERKKVVQYYNSNLDFSKFRTVEMRAETDWNYSYYPIILESEFVLEKVMDELSQANIFPRRYFYPSLNTLPYIHNQSCPISESISKRVLCLPLYVGWSNEDLKRIVQTIHQAV